MEALGPRLLGVTSRRGHEHQHRHEHRGRDSQTRNRGRSLQTIAHRDDTTKLSLGALGRGPTPRPKEKNDEFVQSWLQQTQPRHSHLPEPYHEERQLRLAEQSTSRAHADKHRKRPRPFSDPQLPSPEPAGQVEYRFEKRARHKTRLDKYDYKRRADRKHGRGEGLREYAVKGATGERSRRTEGEHSVGQPIDQIVNASLISRG
jgi:hypothetical protein